MENSQLVTGFAEFYRAVSKEGETRFYPVSDAKQRETAREFDKAGDPPKIKGYGVYDTEVSSHYAVAVYGSEDEARAHGTEQPRTGDQREAAQPDTEPRTEAQPAEPVEEPAERPRKRERGERSDR